MRTGESPQKVAPSRVRGLKQMIQEGRLGEFSRTLTGAWIETLITLDKDCKLIRRTLTGAWIETPDQNIPAYYHVCRTLTGAWIETKIRIQL